MNLHKIRRFNKYGFLNRVLQLLSSQESAANALSKLYYPPVAAVSVSYPKEAIRTECLIDGELKGFGQLHPRTQGVETLGIYLFLFFCELNIRYIYLVVFIVNYVKMFIESSYGCWDFFRNYIQLLALSKSSTTWKNFAVELHWRVYKHRDSVQGKIQQTLVVHLFQTSKPKNWYFPLSLSLGF